MANINNIPQDTLETGDISVKYNSKNLDEDGFVMTFKDLFGTNTRNKFPRDFDAWTVKEQCDWINHNITHFFPHMPQSLLNFFPAVFCELNFDQSEKLPEWIDMEKYRKGQKFVQKHYTAIVISKILGMMYIFSFEEELRPLILGEHCHTPYLGFNKYIFF